MMNDEFKQLASQAMANKGRVLGTLFGFIVGVAALFFGVFKALVLALFIIAGYYIGQRLDNHQGLAELVERFFPPSK